MQSSDNRTKKTPLAGLVEGESVAAAVRRELSALAERDATLATSPLAMTCLTLARELDELGNSATSKSMCARALAEVWAKLLSLAPQDEEHDPIDELQTRRQARLARQANAEDSASTAEGDTSGPGGG